MTATILQITVPLFYLFSATGIARWVSMSWSGDDMERIPAALVVGIFWPVAVPFYAALRAPREDNHR